MCVSLATEEKKIYVRKNFDLFSFHCSSFSHILFSGYKVVLVGCSVKASCPLVGPRSVGGVLSVGVFLRDPSTYLSEFRRKSRKTPLLGQQNTKIKFKIYKQ